MTTFLSILGPIILILVLGKYNYHRIFKNEIRKLYDNSKNNTNEIFTYDCLVGLPDPVQRYLKHVLKEGQPHIKYVRLKHDGQFKPGINKNWSNIKGEQYFTTAKPGFIWKGKIGPIKARDLYIEDKGQLVITLLNLINIAKKQGKGIDQGELLRWLGESVWFPTNLLPCERLKWLPIDDNSAKLVFNYQGISLFYIISFNEKNEIIQLETERYYDNKHIKKWTGYCSNYREINGVKIPTIMRASWRLEEGDHNYVIFHLKDLEYDIPKKY